MAGIASAGWALPRLALKAEDAKKATGAWSARGVVEKTVAEFDEDELTLGVDAAQAAIAAVGLNPGHVEYLAFASVGADPGCAALASLALDTTNAQPAEFRGGGPPFAAALHAALAIAEDSKTTALVIASDCLRALPDEPVDNALGAGAAAFVVTAQAPSQAVGWAFAAAPTLEPSRLGPGGLVRAPQGDDPTPAALLMALNALFSSGATEPGERGMTGYPANSFDRAAGPERGAATGLAQHARGLDAAAIAPPLWPRTGDTGAASAALSLIAALEAAAPDDQLLLADAEGAAGAAFAFKVAERPRGVAGLRAAVEAGRTHLTWQAYLGHRRYLPSPAATHTKSEGAYVSPAAWEETLEARLRLLASRCRSCSVVRHPPRNVCPDCGEGGQTAFQARPHGAVHAATRIGRGGAPSEFAAQQSAVGEYGVVTLDMADGFRMVAQVSGGDPRSIKIGDAVVLRVRRLFEQEGRTRYGLKAVPVGPEHRGT